MSLTIEQLVANTSNLVSLPEVYFRLDELLDLPTVGADEIGAVLSHDPGLAARLLKIVNSAYYGFPGKIDTLSRAVTIIGEQQLRDLVLSTVAVQTFNRIASGLVDMSTFWHHSVYCGVIAGLISRQCEVLHSERLFVAGLLHDVGQLVIYKQLPELASEVLQSAEASDDGLYLSERETLGFTHAEVAAQLFKTWNLPPSLQTVTQFHHEPLKSEDYQLETAIVHLANSAANTIEPGRNILACQSNSDPRAWAFIGLSPTVLEQVMPQAQQQFLELIKIISPDAPLI